MDRKFLTLTAILSAATFGGVWLWTAPPAQSAAAPYVYYPGCDAARAANAAPLYRGDPGYRIEMDGDGDGIACEPHVEGGRRYGRGRGVWRP